jgi:hypothetical protein
MWYKRATELQISEITRALQIQVRVEWDETGEVPRTDRLYAHAILSEWGLLDYDPKELLNTLECFRRDRAEAQEQQDLTVLMSFQHTDQWS